MENPNPRHIVVPTTLTIAGEETRPTAMIDTGATSSFINRKFVEKHDLPTTQKEKEVPVKDVDGRPLGTISEEVQAQLTIGRHNKEITLDVAPIGNHPLILGLPWLQQHNPTINFEQNRVVFASEQCANECLDAAPDVKGRTDGKPYTPPIDNQVYDEEDLEELIAAIEESQEPRPRNISAHIAARHAIEEKRPEEIVPPEYHDFLDVFDETACNAMPPHRDYDLAIDIVPGSILPKPSGLYPMSDADNKELRDWLDDMEAKGFIQKSKSPIAAPCFYVPKKDGKKRLVMDWRKLNEITVKDQFPLPRTDETMDLLRGSKMFSRFDLRNRYNLIRIKKGDEWKTAFKTRWGLFEFKAMHFGLCNAPAVFQRFMNNVLAPVLDITATNYLDNTLSFAKEVIPHIKTNRTILSQFRKHQLFCRAKKCEFHVKETEWLGVHVNENRFRMDQWKTEAITEWKVPKNVTDVRSFLGFVNFYRRFIKDFAKMARPLHDLEKKDTVFQWGHSQQEAFDKIKAAVTTAPVLAHPDPAKPYIVETDASNYAYGAILSQKQAGGKEHPVAFLSKSLSPAERNYDIYDKEMLAVVKALEHWKMYLQGTEDPLGIITDHKNLVYFQNSRITNQRQARWADLLTHYNYTIGYRPGIKSGIPDTLSRRSDLRSEEGDETNKNQQIFDQAAFASIATLYISDARLIDLIKEALDKDQDLKAIIAFFNADPTSTPSEIRKAMKDFTFEDRILYRLGKVYVPNNAEIKRKILELYHDSAIAGHPGQAKTLELVSRGYYWPSQKAYVNTYVEECDPCQRNKNQHAKEHGLLKPLPIPNGPWQSVSYDLITELPESGGYTAILVALCRLTKQAHFIKTRTEVDTEGVVDLLKENVWKLHGFPIETVSDRGPNFESKLIRALYQRLGINPKFSTAYRPQTDGQTERTNTTLETYLRFYTTHRQDDWSHHLALAEFAYNNSHHSSIGMTPFYANYGYNPTFTDRPSTGQAVPQAEELANRFLEIKEELQASMKLAQEKHAEFYNHHHGETPDLQVGDLVLLEGTNIRTDRPTKKLGPKRLGPYRVTKKISTHAYQLELPPSMKIHNVFHVSLLSKYKVDTIHGRIFEEPPPEQIEGEDKYEVEEILNS